MALAGMRQRPMTGDRVSLETLMLRPPAILLRSDYRHGQYSAGQRWLDHPAARRPMNSRVIATDGRLWTCMGPLLIDEIQRLARTGPVSARRAFLLWLRAGGGVRGRCAALVPSRRSARPRIASLAGAVLVELRLPRALLALIYGATLGASGAAIQALFANPLASPDLTGTTSGAALGAVVTAYLFGFAAPIALSIGSVAGALGALVLAARAGRAKGRNRDPAPCRASRSARSPAL